MIMFCCIFFFVVIGVVLLLLISVVIVVDIVLYLFLVVQLREVLQEVNLVVEILVGSVIKYEIKEDGLVYVDCFQFMLVVYLVNYGLILCILVGDNDLLDVLVLICEFLYLGVIVCFWFVGYLKMIDGGEYDEKIIGVLIDSVDLIYVVVCDLEDLLEVECQCIEVFFWVYKELLVGCNLVQFNGWGNVVEVCVLISEVMQCFGKQIYVMCGWFGVCIFFIVFGYYVCF